MLISKNFNHIFIVAFGLSIFISPIAGPWAEASKGVRLAGGAKPSSQFCFFLMAIMGLQVTISFISSRILDVLGHLPSQNIEISRIAFITFIRIFDIHTLLLWR